MINSEFKTIPQYKDYEISKDGEVRNKNSLHILKPKKNKRYLQIGIYKNKKICYHNIHRLVAFAWINTPNNYKKLQVAHNDGNSLNNNYKNLRWATPKENISDKYKHDSFNSPHGENHHNRKLTDVLVVSLRREIKEEMVNCRQLSIKYNIPKLTLYDAVTGRSWKHLNITEAPVVLSRIEKRK